MNVLLYVSSLSLKGGGPSRSVPMMAKGLSEVGIDVILMTQYSDDMNTHALDGTSVRLISLKGGFNSKEIEDFIVKDKIDIVQLQSLWSLDYHKLAKICRKYHIPYLITPRGMLEPWSLSQKRWKKLAAMFLYQKSDLNHAACIYTTSDMEALNVHQLGIKAPCSVIPNGIETDGYPCRTTAENINKQVLFLSRIHVKKGLEILIDVWNDIIKIYPGWKLYIVGNGEDSYISSLCDNVVQMGLQDSIFIQPPVFGESKVELYQSSAIFVLPSYSENFGMVIAEALSCGVPVITTNNTPWGLLNGKEDTQRMGWCIDLTHDNLKKALMEAMNMSFESLFEMGQRASQMVYDNFNYLSVGKMTVKLYQWIIDEGDKPDFVKVI